MGTQANTQHSYTFDQETLLHDGAALTATGAGEVGASAKVIDYGGASAGTGVVNISYTKSDMVADIRAIDGPTVDETYSLIFQLGDASDFSGVIVNQATLPFGLAGGVAGSGADNDFNTGRVAIGVDNVHQSTRYRYARLFVVIGGTAPSIEPFVWLSERK